MSALGSSVAAEFIELQSTLSSQQVMNSTSLEDCAYLRKCGEITVSTSDEECFWLNCLFCPGTCLQYDIFIQHIREQHGQDIKTLYGGGEMPVLGVGVPVGGSASDAVDDMSNTTAMENAMAMELGVVEELSMGGIGHLGVGAGDGDGASNWGVEAKREQATQTRPQVEMSASNITASIKATTKPITKARTMTRTTRTTKMLRTRSIVSLSLAAENNNNWQQNTLADSAEPSKQGKAKPTKRRQQKKRTEVGATRSGRSGATADKVNSARNTRRGRRRSEPHIAAVSEPQISATVTEKEAALTVKNAQVGLHIPQQQPPVGGRTGAGRRAARARQLQQQQPHGTPTEINYPEAAPLPPPTAEVDSVYLVEEATTAAALANALQGEMEMALLEENGLMAAAAAKETMDPLEKMLNAMDSGATEVVNGVMSDVWQSGQTGGEMEAAQEPQRCQDEAKEAHQLAAAKPAVKSRRQTGPKVMQPTRREVFRNKELIAYLLDAYKRNEKLWNPQHPHYKYNAKRSVYNELSEPLLRDMNCQLSGLEIFAILRELKCRYRQELTRSPAAVNGGARKTCLWYFDKFEFLRHLIEHKRAERRAKLHVDTVAAKPLTEQQKMLTHLLAIYKQKEPLWNVKHNDYNSCNRAHLYGEIAAQSQSNMSGKQCEAALLKLRQRYRNELSRLQRCKGLYRPNLWCFDGMAFLREFDERHLTQSVSKKRETKLQSTFLKAESFHFASSADQCHFIDMYRNHTALWHVDHPDYRSNTFRTKALLELLAEYNGAFGCTATIEQLQKTLYQMRKQYTNEKQKLLSDGTAATSSASDVYNKLAEFLDEHLGPFRCDICAALVKTCDQYKIHKSRHNGTAPFVCTICGRGFQMQGNLTIHIRRHKRDFPYSCGVCDKRCATSTEVSIHMRTHTGERPYICDLCGKSFKTYSFFDVHQRMHRQQSNFHCPICERDFYEKNRFTDHMNRHLNIRKHVCEVCGKSYTTAANLRKHQELHLAVKKYKCDECGVHCAQSASLRWHKRRVHGRTALNNEQ